MLKIKDNIDLKELEKFGFTQQYPNTNPNCFWEYTQEYMGDGDSAYIHIYPDNYQVEFLRRAISSEHCDDKLFDLIQAGLVEKERK